MKLKFIIMKKSKLVVFSMLILSILFRGFEALGISHKLIFILDLLNAYLLLEYIYITRGKLKLNLFVVLQFYVLIIGSFVAFLNGINVGQSLWALRNLGRFSVFFLVCSEYIKNEDIYFFWKILRILFYINFAIIVLQYFVLHISQDDLGGIFGTTGSNSYLNIFLLILTTYELTLWGLKKEKNRKIFLMISMALIEAALCELKVYFIELTLTFMLVVVLTSAVGNNIRNLFRYILFGAILLIAMIMAINILYKIYPRFRNFFSANYIIDELTRPGGYTNTGDLNRFTAFTLIDDIIFENNIIYKIWGMGIGAAEFSDSIPWVTGEIYTEYNYLHYQWFSHAWMYIECGLVGVLLYLISFFSVGLRCLKNCKKDIENRKYNITIAIISFMTPLLFVYNQSLRLESAYIVYFCLATPYILKEVNNNVKSMQSKHNCSCL